MHKYYAKKCIVTKDSEGGTVEEYGEPITFGGEAWPASGRVQAEQYGQRLSYIYNVRVNDTYEIATGTDGQRHYVCGCGLDIKERDGICLHVDSEGKPDYRIISIKPYRYLELEVERI